MSNISASEALERLKAGNDAFVSHANESAPRMDLSRRLELVDGQAPFAVILSCSDSRVPAEIIFNQGMGDLF
ncbi:MAG: carbonic anhydrase, partial [Pseudomonadota bacterium]